MNLLIYDAVLLNELLYALSAKVIHLVLWWRQSTIPDFTFSSVNRLVASGLLKLWHGDDWFQRPRK